MMMINKSNTEILIINSFGVLLNTLITVKIFLLVNHL